jgi:hypothetical protein
LAKGCICFKIFSLANFRETKVEESEQTSLTNQAGGELGTEDPYVVDKMGTLINAPHLSLKFKVFTIPKALGKIPFQGS